MNSKQMKWVTVALMLGDVMSGLDSTIINTAIPAIVSSLHGIQFMGWIVATYLLGMSLSIPLWTKIGEKISNKKAFIISIGLFVIGSALQGMAPNIIFFLVARLIMGIGAGGIGSLPYIIMGLVYKNIKKRTKALGYLIGSYNAAAIVGPLIGGWLIDTFSWHWVFYINIPIGVIVFIIWFTSFKELAPKESPVFDIPGAILLSSGLLLFLLGVQLIGISKNSIVISLIVISLILLVLFLIREKYAENPIIPLSIFKGRDLNGDFILFALCWGAFVAINTYLPMWAQALLGMSALLGGMTLIPNSLTNIISSQTVAYVQDRLSTFTMLLIGILTMMFSVGGLLFGTLQTPILLLSLVVAVSGIGVGFIFIALQVKVQIDAGEENLATATSTSYLIRILAQTVMSAVYGVIMNLALNRGIAHRKDITLAMLNKLSDAKSAQTLPKNLLPAMRNIFHSGIREIMMASMLLLIIALILNIYFNGKSKTSQ